MEISADNLAKMRKEYSDMDFDLKDLPQDGNPMTLFNDWLQEATQQKVIEPNAMCLATVGEDGRPSNRYVLLKEVRPNSFVWFTNYESRKGQELAKNPFGALTFWWGSLERSIRIEGTVAKMNEEESNEYWAKRPRGAKIGAWASDQG